MNAPAMLLRRVPEGGEAMIVAKGPFVILAHGLLAIPPEMRGGCWISTPVGDLGPADVEAILRDWFQPASAEPRNQ